ncbi:MAG: right-handed parallel beta-helix repeat-containing protein [Clostridia bacterium]|nr:right-handed parallel beta-helix repeat-containing protein [Clostridia bacterium]
MDFLRTLISIFMAVFVPLSSLVCFRQTPKGENYTQYEWSEKLERQARDMVKSGYDIYVSADGNDENDGSFATPVKSIAAAKQKAKDNRAKTDEPFTVWLRGGDYRLYSPVIFDASDAENVTYRAYENEKVSFNAEYDITGWSETEVNGVKAFVCDVPGELDFNTLIKDDKVLKATRYPESGYLTVEKSDHSDGLFDESDRPWDYTYGDMAIVYPEDCALEQLTLNENTVVRVLHYWCADTSFFARLDKQQNKLFVTKPYTMKVEKGDRFFLENVFELLNTPGEWFFDKENSRVYYVPGEGETADTLVLKACVNTQLINMENAHGITFEDITFKNTDWCYPALDPENSLARAGLKHPQAEFDSEGAVRVSASDGISFINCDFLNIGNTAIKFDRMVKNSTVEKCRFNEIGANCVYIHGYNATEKERITENIRVVNNRIEGYGRVFADAIGVLVTHARNCEISHNEISDGYYTAISVGWVWGYSYSVTCNNKITDNLIYDIGQGWLSDMGGIYTLGIQPGTVISGNTIHNVAADPGEGGYGGWGVYLDEGSSYITVKNNLAYDCGSQGLHQHYGKDNTVTNNIFAMNRLGQVRSSRKEEHTAFYLTGNIIAGDSAMITNIECGKINDKGNLYWDYKNGENVLSSKNEDLSFDNRAYAPYMKTAGYYKSAVFENPLFKDAHGFDFNLAANSPAIEKIGFVPWDYTQAGTDWKA